MDHLTAHHRETGIGHRAGKNQRGAQRNVPCGPTLSSAQNPRARPAYAMTSAATAAALQAASEPDHRSDHHHGRIGVENHPLEPHADVLQAHEVHE